MPYTLEHSNLSVPDPQETINFLLTAIPHWKIRSNGVYSEFEPHVNWWHVGDENTYIAIQDDGDEKLEMYSKRWTGIKHLGFSVPDLAALISRLNKKGYCVSNESGPHPHRKGAYFHDRNGIEYEFIQYLSENPVERNDYSI